MLRFAVYDRKGPASDWPLAHAHLFGADDLAASGTIRFGDGCIICERRGNKATGLALQYDAGAAGRLMLQTCLLQESDEPYVLSHELTRHRIKTFLVKCEEWQMFELSAEHPAMQSWEQARQLFTRGLNEKDPVLMDRYGRASLERAVEATERLAMAHAEILLHRRYGSKPATNTTLGVRIDPKTPPERYTETLSREFDLIYIPLYWRDLEVREGEYNWGPVDRWMNWAHQHKRPVVAGPLLDFSARAVPDWMHVWQNDYDTCRDLAYDHIERVAHRYQNAVSIWSIASGLNVNDNFRFTESQMLDLTRMANLMVRQSKRGRTMLEIVHPFGEHVGRNAESIPPLTYIDRVVQEGIRVSCYGVQFEFCATQTGIPYHDIMRISDALDRYFMLELPVLITSLGVPSDSRSADEGYWQQPWTPDSQSRWAARAFPLTMSKPHVESFFWSALEDGRGSDPQRAGLYSAAGQAKPVLERLISMRRRLRKSIGPLRLANKGMQTAG